MSAEEMHPTPLSEKNGAVGRPEADEDARTESSEGSNTQTQWTPEAGESEDEFEDAMEPPSSTSGMLLAFDGAAAPLSGVYEDAVEATDEQVLAAIVSTGSNERQSTIREEEEDEQEEEKESGMEDEVVAVVDGIVERVAAVEYEAIDEEEVDIFVDEVAAETVAETLDEDVREVLTGEIDTVIENVAEDAEVEERSETPEEPEKVAEAEDKAAEIVGELGENTKESTPETLAVVEADKLEDGAVPDATEEVAPVSDFGSIKTDPGSDVDLDTEVTSEGEVVDDKPIGSLSEQESTDIAEADARLLVDENVAEAPCEPLNEEEAPTTDSTEGATTAVEEVVAQVTDELVEAVLLNHDKTELADEEELEEKPAPVSAVKEVATGENTLEADDIVVQEDSEDNNVEAEGEQIQNPAEEEEAIIPPAPAAKDGTSGSDSYRKSCNDHPNSGVLLPVLGLLEPSSGATTTTTIEPFVLSSESNEMLEVHLPPQRWTYEVYGFSIEDRVVYYHIHRSDRRTGIREPPILKRYTDFRELQIQLFDTRLHAATEMPRIPRPHLGTVFRGYKSKKTIEIREKAFRSLLRYISQYPALHGSAVFERFITTTRASTGAGWM